MHDGECIQSAFCPRMSSWLVFSDETRPHISMEQRLDLQLDSINQIGNYPSKYEIFIGWFLIRCVGEISVDFVSDSDRHATGR